MPAGEGWGLGGAQKLGGMPTAARSQPTAGKPRRRRRSKAPVRWEEEDEQGDYFAKTEKFRGLTVN